MRPVNARDRHRRMRQALEEAWAKARNTPEDPGLRDVYGDIPRAPIRLLVGPLNKDVNQGGLLRLAEAFRVERVDFHPERDGATDMAGSRGTGQIQPWRWCDQIAAIREAKAQGYRAVALTLSERAVPLDGFEFEFPLALVIGAELEGISPEAEAECEAAIAIPLYGMVQSLNVAVATGMALQHAISAYAHSHPDFTPVRRASRELLGLPPIDYTKDERP